jgi:hypothetical protein
MVLLPVQTLLMALVVDQVPSDPMSLGCFAPLWLVSCVMCNASAALCVWYSAYC